MHPRQKKLIVALSTMPFLVVYMGAVLAIWDRLPGSRLVDLVFFVLAGTLWAFPLKPVMLWMNKEPAPKDDKLSV